MVHKGRKWYARDCDDLYTLEQRLRATNLPFNAAFRTAAGTIWANDTGPESRFRTFVALRSSGDGDYRQVDAVSVDACDTEELLEFLEQADEADEYADIMAGPRIDARQICLDPN